MRRREFLIGSGAALGASGLPPVARTPTARGESLAWATSFDGNTMLLNEAPVIPKVGVTRAVAPYLANGPTLVGGFGLNGGAVVLPYVGDLADVFVYAGGDIIDPADPATLAGFYATERGFAVRKASN